jgi:aryl-alcohol dehydrogenase-like predicted oxidoreductase
VHARAIPSTGEALPVIGLGTWQTFDVAGAGAQREARASVLDAFAAHGAKVVDTSPMYGRAEEVLGALLAGHGLRARLFLATKVWTTDARRASGRWRRRSRSFEPTPSNSCRSTISWTSTRT